MKSKRMVYIFTVLSVCILSQSNVVAQSSLEKHEPLAANLVNQVANIQENDFVWISGSTRDADLMDEIAVQASKVGAHYIVTLDSEYRNRRYFDVVPEKYDSKEPEFFMKFVDMVHTVISIDAGESIGLFRDVPSERIAAISEATSGVPEIFRKNNIRTVNLGNGLYPTDALADQFGISKTQLTELFWNGVNVDYQALQREGNAIKQILASGKKIRITSTAGTDITMVIEARPVFVSDGVISNEEMEAGYPQSQVWLPAGEVYVTPVVGTVAGKVILDKFHFQGEEINQLELTFEAGKLVSMTAESGLGVYRDRYDAAGEGKDEFSFVDVGINPEVNIIPGSNMVAWMASGVVTVGIGNNTWAGGDNDSSYGSTFHLKDATLMVDDEIIVEKGALKRTL